MRDERIVVELDYPGFFQADPPRSYGLCSWARDSGGQFEKSVRAWDKNGEAIWTDAYSFSLIAGAKSFAERARRFFEVLLGDTGKGFSYQIRISSAVDRAHPSLVIGGLIGSRVR